MNFLIMSVFLSVAPIMNQCSKCITLRKKGYTKQVLSKSFQSPCQLTIDPVTETLFFSYTTHKFGNASHNVIPPFKLAYLNLKTKEFGIINSVQGGFATAIDDDNLKLYVGGENGIYTLDPVSYRVENLNIINASIWQMFYRKALYFTTYPDQKAFLYKDEKVTEVPVVNKSKVKMIAAKKDGSIIFHNTSGLFTCRKHKETAIKKGDFVLTGFTSDGRNNLYFSTADKIYRIYKTVHKDRSKIQEMGNLGDIYGFAMESNGNFIYATQRRIIRLIPREKVCDVVSTTKHPPATVFH